MRLDATVSVALAPQAPPANPSVGYQLPLGSTGDPGYPEWIVPTQTSSVHVAGVATLPIVFDFGPFQGDPDLLGAPTSPTSAAGSYTPAGGTVQPGFWGAAPTEIGPYSGPAPPGDAQNVADRDHEAV